MMSGHESRSAWSFFIASNVAVMPLFGGCAIHPLPENVTGLDTVAIVQKLRCESRRAIKDQVIYLLENDGVADEETIRNATSLIEKNFPALRSIDQKKFSARTRMLINRYDDALIFMDFTFMISEENNSDLNINLLSTLTRGSDALNIKASNNRKRQNTRNFRVQDSFVGLFGAELTCMGRSRQPDIMYPVTGEIGIAEVIDTFIRLNETRALTNGSITGRQFADTLSFTTTVSGSLGPKIVLSPVGKPISLADAAFTSTSMRTDMHDVLIGLSLPKEEVALADQEIRTGRNSTRRNPPSDTRESKVDQAIGLNRFMDFQLGRNLILNAPVNLRPIAVSVF